MDKVLLNIILIAVIGTVNLSAQTNSTEEEPKVINPNIITPNGDRENDLFELNFPYKNVVIYNRWGHNLFESNNYAFWNGRTTSGSEVPEGTYFYIITTEKEIYKGTLQLFR